MGNLGIPVINTKPKKKLPKKLLMMVVGIVVLLALLAVVVYFSWMAFVRPVAADQKLVMNAIAAIDKNDLPGLTNAAESIKKTSRYQTSPEYLTVLIISAIRNREPSDATQYLKDLKGLGNFSYADYTPWKNRDNVIASFEHDIAQLEIMKKGQKLDAVSGGGP